MKKVLFAIAALAAVVSCQKNNGDDPVKVPESGFGIYVNKDGSVIVEGDNGVDRVNSLMAAIQECADKNVLPNEGKDSVACSNVFILQRDADYYVNANFNVESEVTIKAAEGKGAKPKIQRLYDETGALPGNLMVLYKSIVLEGLHMTSAEGTDGNTTESTGLRIKKAGVNITMKDCLCECFRKTFVRCDASDNSFDFQGNVFRNFGNISGVNEGRIIDTRGANQKSVKWENNLFYHTQGQLLRDGDKAEIETIEIRNNTFVCVGNVPDFTKPRTLIIENNIYENVGWKDEADAKLADETGKVITSFFRFSNCPDEDFANVKSIVIRNNNIYETAEQTALIAKFAEKATRCTGLDEQGLALQKAGKLQMKDNIEEILTYTNPCPSSMDFIELYYANLDTAKDNPALFSGKNFYFTDKDYSYTYPSTAKSAKASTTGGKIGASI